jgi:DNA-binding LacI/PurR family transcriptional regulator
VQLITVGVDSIRFSGLQRFYKTLLDQESGSKIRTHLKWAIDAAEITPDWIEQMDGVILAGHFDRYELLESLTQDIPCIGVITPQNWNADFMIDSDNQQIGALAADHLWQSGATSSCVVAYSNQDGRHSLRKLGFQAKWIENGGSLSDFDEHWIDPTNTYKRVFELEQIARNLGDHDAVFCLEKESAIDLLNIFDCIGVNVPEEVKVISVDGTFEGLKTTPKLTYVKQKFEEMATIAAEQMRLLCADKANATTTDAKKKILVPAEIVLREST